MKRSRIIPAHKAPGVLASCIEFPKRRKRPKRHLSSMNPWVAAWLLLMAAYCIKTWVFA